MSEPTLLEKVEKTLGFSFRKVLEIESYFNDPEVYPDSYREVMTMEQEMVRDWHGGNAFLDAEGRLLGINLYDQQVDNHKIHELLALDLPDLHALNLNQTGFSGGFTFSEKHPSLIFVNLSQNEGLTEVVFDHTPKALKGLDLYDCRIKALDLPEGLGELVKVDISRNQQLEQLTFGTGCEKLWFVDFSDNQVKSLAFPAGCKALQYVYAKGNQIESFSFAGDLPSLDILDLRDNKLEAFPKNFIDLQGKLDHLYVGGNPMTQIPEGIIPEDDRANAIEPVMSYLRAFKRAKAINNRVKMIIVGNGRVGKTSMFRRLMGEEFDPEEPFTHGIHLGHLTEENLPVKKIDNLQMNVWDFGGQEIFYATHQFFLTRDAVYVLAWTSEENIKEHIRKAQVFFS